MTRIIPTTIRKRIIATVGIAAAVVGVTAIHSDAGAVAARPAAVHAASFTIPHDSALYADSFVRAFGAKNTSRVRLLATTTAANNAIAHYWIAGPTWVRLHCDGAAGSLYCKYGNGSGRFMLVRVSNFDAMQGHAHSVMSVSFSRFVIPNDSCVYADSFVRAFGARNSDLLRLLGTSTSANRAISHYSIAGPTWVRTRCEGAAGSMFATYRDGHGHHLLIQVSNFDAQLRHAHAVVGVTFS